jgi:hypothetical protein
MVQKQTKPCTPRLRLDSIGQELDKESSEHYGKGNNLAPAHAPVPADSIATSTATSTTATTTARSRRATETGGRPGARLGDRWGFGARG